MDTINGAINLMLILVPVGATFRITLCLIYAAAEEDPSPYKRKAKNALIYMVLAEGVVGVIKLIANYFGGGAIY